jgi:hypothetical protein
MEAIYGCHGEETLIQSIVPVIVRLRFSITPWRYHVFDPSESGVDPAV